MTRLLSPEQLGAPDAERGSMDQAWETLDPWAPWVDALVLSGGVIAASSR
jgi:hypothetical protein